MCDPMTIASVAISAVGTGMQMQAQKKAQKAINNAVNANGIANDKLREQSRQGVVDTTQKFSRESFDRNQADETGKVQAKLTDALSAGKLPGEYYGGAQSENTRGYTEQKTTETNDFSKQMADALARLRGFGQGQAVNTQRVQRAGEVVGMNQNKEAGNNAVLPLQIEAAKQKGSSPLGDLFTGIGSATLGPSLSSSGSFLGDVGAGLKSGLNGTGFGTGYDVSKAVRTNPAFGFNLA